LTTGVNESTPAQKKAGSWAAFFKRGLNFRRAEMVFRSGDKKRSAFIAG
jgi:hypothetical protein